MGFPQLMTMPLSVLFIVSCSSGPAGQTPDPPPPAKTVFDPLLQAEQRARDVQNTVDQHADAARKAVDSQERGDTPP